MGKWTQHRTADAQTVKVFFSNPDLLWATDYPAPRFGQGAFAAALQTLHLQVGSCSLPAAGGAGALTDECTTLAACTDSCLACR